MAILEMIASTFAIVYLFLILEIVFSSTKTIMYKQQAFEGRLLFFIYSLIVYYKGIRFNIFFLDTFLNGPIIQAYELLNTFLTNFFGLTISAAETGPWAVFLFLMPASFVYHFTNYWFRYGFGDNRIAKMVSFLAVVIFLSSMGNMGLLSFVSSPILNVAAFSGMPILSYFVSATIKYLPTADLTSAVLDAQGWQFLSGFSGEFAALIVLVVVIALAFLIYYVGSYALKHMAVEEFSNKEGFLSFLYFFLYAIGFSGLTILFSGLLLYGGLNMTLASKFLDMTILLLILAGLALIAEIIVFAAIYAMMKNLRTAFGS